MVLALAAKALLAVLIFGTIAKIDDIVDYLVGPMPGIETDISTDEE